MDSYQIRVIFCGNYFNGNRSSGGIGLGFGCTIKTGSSWFKPGSKVYADVTQASYFTTCPVFVPAEFLIEEAHQ